MSTVIMGVVDGRPAGACAGVLARSISVQPTVAAAWQRLTEAALAQIPAADAAGVTVPGTHRFTTVAATSDLPARVDALQYEFGGPCLDALLGAAEQVRVDDLATEARWPLFTAAALAQTPARSMLSSRLYLDPATPIAALNLYSATPHAFDATCTRAVALLSAHAAPAAALVAERERTANLLRALASNRSIGVAMGVLMARHRITADEAFDLLRTASQHSHRKLRDIAADVAETGALDLGTFGPHGGRATRAARDHSAVAAHRSWATEQPRPQPRPTTSVSAGSVSRAGRLGADVAPRPADRDGGQPVGSQRGGPPAPRLARP